MLINCKFCSRLFEQKRLNEIFCSKFCCRKFHKHNINMQEWEDYKKSNFKEKKCKYCGKAFITNKKSFIYCSKECLIKSTPYKSKIIESKTEDRICKECGDTFQVTYKISCHKSKCSNCVVKNGKRENMSYQQKFLINKVSRLRKRNRTIEQKEYDKKKYHNWYERNKERVREDALINYYKNKPKHVCRQRTNVLIRQRKIRPKKFCKICNTNLKLELHHEVYPDTYEEILKAYKQGKIYYLCHKHHPKGRPIKYNLPIQNLPNLPQTL